MEKILLLIIITVTVQILSATSSDFSIKTRYNYYTNENEAELLILNHQNKDSAQIEIYYQKKLLKQGDLECKDVQLISFPLKNIPFKTILLDCVIISSSGEKEFQVKLIKLSPKKNKVKIDLLNGGLIVDELPFIPFGFYCYWPVQPTLAEEEIVKGFNMISPYQKIEKKTLKERRAYMDRCAALGMKVNYNLCSLGGGGGVGSARLKSSDDNIEKMLVKEINEFKDHPALLAWYISDEPALNKVSPELLKNTYDVIKKNDPYHPITIVFMNSSKAWKYKDAMDIVMADPYPIPTGKVTKVESVTKKLTDRFKYEMPVWIVPQAFGGNEWWKREPTSAELRVMTYLSFLNDAKGIQYFVRHGLSAFPKSATTWNECGKITLEIAELTPILLQNNKSYFLNCSEDKVKVKAWEDDDQIVIIAVNTANKPLEIKIDFKEKNMNKEVELIFENRSENIKKGVLNSFIDAFGSRIYRIDTSLEEEIQLIHPKNLTLDSGFEDVVMPGVPTYCYAKTYGERCATYFIDSRISFEGKHSLRLNSPKENGGIFLKFYRIRLKKNRTYTYSIMAKAKRIHRINPRGFWQKFIALFKKKEQWNTFKMTLGDTSEIFELSEKWEKYSITVPIKEVSDGSYLTSPRIQMIGKGTAWFDLIQVIPDISFDDKLNIKKKHIKIELTPNVSDSKIFYTIDGNEPNENSLKYENAFTIDSSCTLKAKLISKEGIIGKLEKNYLFHKAVGAKVTYLNPFSPAYKGGGKLALVNQKTASSNYKNKAWQGFNSKDLNVILNLGEKQEISEIKIGFLHNHNSWIFLPKKIEMFYSEDGKSFQSLVSQNIELDKSNEKYHKKYELLFVSKKVQYIKVIAKSMGNCPSWHKASGKPAYLFVDEIEVN
ncbi:MAG: chitobiase/beta-hexosaminidase C-terminal domain-containing protein [Candidatus Cloacimonetes bacterium]|nr:chitobiase/beta-hexosaminidase C-terminal domain-containing protein [Candidatus Cloacimonadota bacterium]